MLASHLGSQSVGNRGQRLRVVALRAKESEAFRPALLLLCLAAGLILLLTCANIAHLSIVRADSRRVELSVRRALGAGWGQIFRLLLAETMLLAFAGGTLGVLLAKWALQGVKSLQITAQLQLDQIRLESEALLLTLMLCFLIGVVLAVIPATRLREAEILPNLRGATYRAAGKLRLGGQYRLSSELAAVQVAVAVVLTNQCIRKTPGL
ncbi:MAG: FtsX-like permease family protein [Acidobacteriia bacterium]|nr:FtsX-like permease family protein [Terriglobia bacterium]